MHSLQEARTLGPLCGRSLILRHLKDIHGDRPTPKLRIWGSEVRILPGAPAYFVKTISYAALPGCNALAGDLCPSNVRNHSLEVPNLAPRICTAGRASGCSPRWNEAPISGHVAQPSAAPACSQARVVPRWRRPGPATHCTAFPAATRAGDAPPTRTLCSKHQLDQENRDE